jgi:hypothetical protein
MLTSYFEGSVLDPSALYAQTLYGDDLFKRLTKYDGEQVKVYFLFQQQSQMVIVPPLMFHVVKPVKKPMCSMLRLPHQQASSTTNCSLII